MKRTFDVVVVGGGTAGCVIAARASEQSNQRVLLIEAGPDPRPVPGVIADPKRQPELLLESPYIRMYPVRRPIDGSELQFISGRVIGGGSSVNNMSVIRPIRRDFDAWVGFGGEAWSYDALLPLMRAIEDDPDFGDSPIHGIGGPLHLERAFKLDSPASPPVRALIETSVEIGLPECDDMNIPEPLGVCASPYNILDGVRQSTAVAYLERARARPNLTILANTTATRLILHGQRVVSVEVDTPDGPRSVETDRVVLSAGVFHSPQLLTLSGIGQPEAIERLGLRVAHRLAGVGENYQDHAAVFMTFEGTSDVREDYVIPWVRLVAKSDPSLSYGDLHIFIRPATHIRGLPPLLPISIYLLDHRSRGRVVLTSPKINALPTVEPALLEHPDDLRAMTNAMRFVTDLVGRPKMRTFYSALVQPGPEEDWETYARSTFATYWHGVGTCRMGPSGDPFAVVDEQLRVHGLENLWVGDASALPVVPHANTNFSAILVGEIAVRSLMSHN